MAIDLQGRVAFVTGGSRGIGRAIAIRLGGAGAAVALTYRVEGDAAAAVVAEIVSAGGRATAFPMEVTDRTSIEAALDGAEATFGPLSILVNNAGINKPTDFDRIEEADWDSIMAVNLKGPFLCSQAALPRMAKAGGGAIVNIGSVSGQYGGPRTAHYAASKAGLISLGQVIARFGAASGVRCNTVAAGLIGSEMAAAGMQSAAVQQAAAGIVAGRLGEAREVADAVAFLASDEASYITAQTVNVNGGLYF
ncbi:3-oxoacyl-ACP reductase family protein [Oceanibacterium hippocampi]|uniref:3-oxoacyl-[acyl-carrier-protein] reductase FabG n=1 Tax=Oceanibacterium hippocampi TaxID=745714 RepID=A0A1Y5SDH7_9PROT|nr:3-oxoacyl-ACP reductase family protein [Oceanibacterium hippocampi]SLN38204.1 3-oxoacyl-[acyl-carrier-protein] reductase FabG [Oceanibacterium hippocampi]